MSHNSFLPSLLLVVYPPPPSFSKSLSFFPPPSPHVSPDFILYYYRTHTKFHPFPLSSLIYIPGDLHSLPLFLSSLVSPSLHTHKTGGRARGWSAGSECNQKVCVCGEGIWGLIHRAEPPWKTSSTELNTNKTINAPNGHFVCVDVQCSHRGDANLSTVTLCERTQHVAESFVWFTGKIHRKKPNYVCYLSPSS